MEKVVWLVKNSGAFSLRIYIYLYYLHVTLQQIITSLEHTIQ